MAFDSIGGKLFGASLAREERIFTCGCPIVLLKHDADAVEALLMHSIDNIKCFSIQ
jgi:hypothetical protein